VDRVIGAADTTTKSAYRVSRERTGREFHVIIDGDTSSARMRLWLVSSQIYDVTFAIPRASIGNNL